MYLYRTFCNFLSERGCEKAFREAFANQNPGYELNAALWEIMGGDEFFLGRAFDWSMTCQGRGFWLEIDKEWGKVCDQLNSF